MIVLLLTVALNVSLIMVIPKGFFPQQDTGAITGGMQGPQDTSFPAMNASLQRIVGVIKADPAVANVIAFTGGGGATNTGFIFIALKPLAERKIDARARHRPHSAQAEQAAGSLGLPAGGAGHPHRRPRQQRHVPVHAAGGQRQRPGQVGPAAAQADEAAARLSGRQLRPAERRPAI